MTADIAEFKALTAKRSGQRTTRDKPQLEMLAQAAVKAEALTNDPAWDQFLSFLQAARDKLSVQAESLSRQLRNPMLLDRMAIDACRAALVLADAQVGILDAVILLPKDIKEHGAEAKDLLSRLAGNEGEKDAAP